MLFPRSGVVDNPRVVLAQITLPRRIGGVGVARTVRVGPDRVVGERVDRGAVRGIQIRVFDPAIAVEQEVSGPSRGRLR